MCQPQIFCGNGNFQNVHCHRIFTLSVISGAPTWFFKILSLECGLLDGLGTMKTGSTVRNQS